MNLTITDKAKGKLQSYQTNSDQFLRISVVSGGCSGMTYKAGVDSSIREDDEIVYQDQNIKVVADGRSSLFLDGLHIDYSDDLIKTGFRLTNPNATSSCACGSSFAV